MWPLMGARLSGTVSISLSDLPRTGITPFMVLCALRDLTAPATLAMFHTALKAAGSGGGHTLRVTPVFDPGNLHFKVYVTLRDRTYVSEGSVGAGSSRTRIDLPTKTWVAQTLRTFVQECVAKGVLDAGTAGRLQGVLSDFPEDVSSQFLRTEARRLQDGCDSLPHSPARAFSANELSEALYGAAVSTADTAPGTVHCRIMDDAFVPAFDVDKEVMYTTMMNLFWSWPKCTHGAADTTTILGPYFENARLFDDLLKTPARESIGALLAQPVLWSILNGDSGVPDARLIRWSSFGVSLPFRVVASRGPPRDPRRMLATYLTDVVNPVVRGEVEQDQNYMSFSVVELLQLARRWRSGLSVSPFHREPHSRRAPPTTPTTPTTPARPGPGSLRRQSSARVLRTASPTATQPRRHSAANVHDFLLDTEDDNDEDQDSLLLALGLAGDGDDDEELGADADLEAYGDAEAESDADAEVDAVQKWDLAATTVPSGAGAGAGAGMSEAGFFTPRKSFRGTPSFMDSVPTPRDRIDRKYPEGRWRDSALACLDIGVDDKLIEDVLPLWRAAERSLLMNVLRAASGDRMVASEVVMPITEFRGLLDKGLPKCFRETERMLGRFEQEARRLSLEWVRPDEGLEAIFQPRVWRAIKLWFMVSNQAMLLDLKTELIRFGNLADTLQKAQRILATVPGGGREGAGDILSQLNALGVLEYLLPQIERDVKTMWSELN